MIDIADVVSVPEAAGREALARLLAYAQPAVAPGPVAATANGRVYFYVAPGGREDLPELLEWLDWGGVQLDLVAFAADELPDPPVRWLHPDGETAGIPNQAGVPNQVRRPPPANTSVRPEAPDTHATTAFPEPPELIALLATIAAACHRLAVTRGARTGRDVQRLG